MSSSQTPVKTALLSYGMSGEVFHGPLLSQHSGFSVRSVLHRKPPGSPRHPFKVVSSAESVFSDREVELVIVNTPNDTHFHYARNAIEAGKHVVVEKPFTVTAAEADELINLARTKGTLLTVFQNRRWDGDFLTVRAVLDKKLVDKLVEFEAHYDRFRNEIDLSSWKETGGSGRGVLYNLGSHMIDQALTLFGSPRFVDARVGVQRPGGEVDDFYDVRMEYNGFFVILKSSYLVKDPGARYTIHGTRGSFLKYGLDPQEEDLKRGKTPGRSGWGTEPCEWWGKLTTDTEQRQIETQPGNYMAFYDNLYHAIRKGTALAVTPESARDVIRIIEYCYESNRTRSAVPVTG